MKTYKFNSRLYQTKENKNNMPNDREEELLTSWTAIILRVEKTSAKNKAI